VENAALARNSNGPAFLSLLAKSQAHHRRVVAILAFQVRTPHRRQFPPGLCCPGTRILFRKTVGSVFKQAVLPVLGDRELESLTREPLQACLNYMTEMPVGKEGRRRGYSKSAIQKAQRNMHAMFEFAIDENLIERNPARKLELPRAIRKPCERFFTLDEVRRFMAAAEGRERIILRLLMVCGLRPAEVFALRRDDIGAGILRIDEAVKDLEKGAARLGGTKTEESDGHVALPADLEKDLRAGRRDFRIAHFSFRQRREPLGGLGTI